MEKKNSSADIIIIGSGLSGLVAAAEAASRKKTVILIDQEGEQNMGGQAFWSFGGLFLVNSKQQRRMGIKDSYELAYQDWMGSAQFDRLEDEDYWAFRWAESYLQFAYGEKASWLKSLGHSFFPVVGWAERGGGLATGHGNSVPRFHITWGTGPGLVAPFERQVREYQKQGLIQFKFRHKVTEIHIENNTVKGVEGIILEPSLELRGVKSSRIPAGEFHFQAQVVIVTSGGIGGNRELVRKNWPERLGKPPEKMVVGVPDYVDGSMVEVLSHTDARFVNSDRMWHYTEGLQNWNPIWTGHGIRILPGPSSLWFDALGNRFPPPLMPGFDTLSTLKHIVNTGYEYSWFILNQKIIQKEFALSGSEQNPDLTDKNLGLLLKRIFNKKRATEPVEAFKEKGADFIVKNNLGELVEEMNKLVGNQLLEYDKILNQILARDREMENKFSKDAQVIAIRNSRKHRGDRLIRTAPPHKILDPQAGPLIAVRLNILTRKTLGGLQTNLSGAVLNKTNGNPIQGLFAAGEISGFGGGGMHGYNALEGTFLGGCLFSGRKAGEGAAESVY